TRATAEPEPPEGAEISLGSAFCARAAVAFLASNCPTNSAALARIGAPCERSTASRAISGNTVVSPAPARYMASAIATTARRRSPLPYHWSIIDAAHSGDLSSWHVVHAFASP